MGALAIGGVLAAIVASGGVATGASTATTTVSVTVASATSINAAGCASGTANVTDFGTVLPATSNVTSTDCTVVFGSSNDTSMLRAYQTDQAGSALFGLSNGSLDTTFDGDGKVTGPFPSGNDYGYGVATQADGKLVVAGVAREGGITDDFGVVRYNTDGSLDTTFDTDGRVTTPILAQYDYGYRVAIQADGKILVSGRSYNGANSDFAIARYNTDGSLDVAFDTDGKTTTDVGGGYDYAYGLVVQSDGKIVVAGATADFAAVRYNTDGSLDTTFDGDGMVTTPVLAGTDTAWGAALQADGRLVLAGSAHNGVDDDFAVVRYNLDGSLDTTFDGDGKVTTPILAGADVARSVLIQPDGKIVVTGQSNNGANDDMAVVRYNANGSLDTTFDGDGKVTTPILSAADIARSVMLQQNGKIVVAGSANNGVDYDFAAARYNTDGSLDTAFDTDGKVTTPVLAANDYGQGGVIQQDGKIVVAGYAYNGATDDFAVLRYGSGGSVADWAGSWGAANLFGACLHTVANATNTWTLAGNGNCTTAIDANWNALPTTASKIASAGSGVTNATTNLRYGFKATASQQAGTYVAPLTFEVVAPNA